MNMEQYNLLCDELYLDMYLNTKMELPNQSETVLTFFERIRKQYPSMSNFYRRQQNFYLEDESGSDQYHWVALEGNRIGSGIVNPVSFDSAGRLGKLVLELVPYMLAVTPLDVDSLEVSIGMDFDYSGNHDEIIAEALLACSPLNCLLEAADAEAIDCSPLIVVSLSEDRKTQARISIESKTSLLDPREKINAPDKFISLLFAIQQFPKAAEKFDPLDSLEKQSRLAEKLLSEKIVPNIVQPLINTIAQKKFI